MSRQLLGYAAFRELVQAPQRPPASSHEPAILELEDTEFDDFVAFCDRHALAVCDEIERQVHDLVAARFPTYDHDDVRAAADAALAQAGRHAFGCWIYYPWLARVVHLLAADDFYEVITNRNQNKITRAEQDLLRTKRIGVMGLSVGGEAAVTVAQEHLCGEIVLADFDRLDLSNLNRMGAGVDELGVNKAVIVARRIARIDPYLKVLLYPEGVTPANIDAFLDGLDLLIEESDGLPIKYEIRSRARSRRLNVVFAGDERGFLSVEPYATSRDLEPFHGRLSAPQPPREAYADLQSFLRTLTVWLGGWSHISERSRASLLLVGTTLRGYPQLASETRYAAGQLGHVSRRLLLGEPLQPFVGHHDLTELILAESAARPDAAAENAP